MLQVHRKPLKKRILSIANRNCRPQSAGCEVVLKRDARVKEQVKRQVRDQEEEGQRAGNRQREDRGNNIDDEGGLSEEDNQHDSNIMRTRMFV